MLDQVDVDRLTEILDREGDAAGVSVVYCQECGFQNPEAANYCSRCGALLQKGEASVETTQTFSPEEVGELDHEPVIGLEGPALVVRAGRRPGGGELPSRRASARASAVRPTARSSSTTSPSRATTPC